MSSGKFIKAIYQGDDFTSFYAVRVQPETTAAILNLIPNASQAGPVNRLVTARVRGGRRQRGIICRSVGVKFTGALPDGYKPDQVIYIPVMGIVHWRNINPTSFRTGTYLGLPVVIVSKQPEYIN